MLIHSDNFWAACSIFFATAVPGFGSLNNGLVAWYPLDGNGSNLANSQFHATLTGAVPAPNRFNQPGKALQFDGVDDYLQSSHDSALSNNEFSYSLWAKPTATSSLFGSPLTFRGNVKGFNLYKDDNNAWSYWIGNGGWVMLGNQAISLTWTFLGFTYDGSAFKTYQNGALLSSDNGSFSLNSSSPLRIGAGKTEAAPDYFFEGLIDEVRIYNRALSTAEMQDLYFLGRIFSNSSLSINENSSPGTIVGQFHTHSLDLPTTFALSGHTSNAQHANTNGGAKVSFLVDGSWTAPESFFTAASEGQVLNKTFTTSSRPTRLKIIAASNDAWGYWKLSIDNSIILEDPNGIAGTTSSNNPYWVDGNQDHQIPVFQTYDLPAPGGNFSFSNENGSTHNSHFSIDQNGTLSTLSSFDYEANNSLSVRIQFIDDQNNSTSEVFSIEVLDIIEDLDGDGIQDHLDSDRDGDGFPNSVETTAGTNADSNSSFPGLDYGLVAHYSFDGNASDSSVHARHGDSTGFSFSTDRHQRTNSAIHFDKSQTLKIESFPFQTPYSLTGWFNIEQAPPTVENEINLVGFDVAGPTSGVYTHHSYRFASSTLRFLNRIPPGNSGGSESFVQYSPSLNSWFHLSYVKSSTELKTYLNGALANTTSDNSNVGVTPVDLYFGGYSGGRNWIGSIDEVYIHNRPLNASEIATLYQPTNSAPHSLGPLNPLSFSENSASGSLIGEFNAIDSDAGSSLTYQLISGEGSDHNSLFSLDANGSLKNFAVFDFETNSSSYTIRVQVRDEFNATSDGNFTISLADQFEDLDGDGQEDHLDSDRDGDGLSNLDEISHGTNPDDPNSTVNLPPHSLAISQVQFNENLPVGSTIANLSAIDPNQDNLSFSFFSFSPLDLNPVLWLDADDPTTISNSSGNVSGWNDKSGGNHNYSQSNQQLRPVLRQNKINGKPAVKFDGFNDFLSLNSRLGLSANPALTISAVLINQTNNMIDQRIFQLGGSDFNTIGISTGFEGWAWRFNGGNKRFGSISNLQTQVVSWVRSAGSNFQQSSFYLNGIQRSSVAGSGSASPTNTSNFSTLGSGSGTGSSSPTLAFNGFLGEFIILNSSSGNDRESIENYLSHKWGLGASSPSTPDGFLLESNGTLKTSASFDFENNQSTYQFWVRAADEQNQSVEGNFTLSLVDLFEDLDGDGTEDHADTDDDGDGFSDAAELAYGSDPRDPNSVANAAPDSLELNGSTILENQAPHTVVGLLTATDPDPNSTLSFSLVEGNGTNHNAFFHIHQNQILRSLQPFDFETNASTYPIRVRVSDQHGTNLERIFLISLLNQVEDLDGDGTEDYFDHDDDGDGFPDSAEIAYGSNPSDPNSVANAAPDSLQLNGSTILENQAPNTMVGQLIATDPDANATLSFSLVEGNGSNHNALFQIHQNQILRSLQPFDFETNATTYSVRVRASDQHGAKLERIFLISLLNQVEDLDGDGIEDYFDPDDDGDGFSDSAEVAYGSDPRDPNSVANTAPDSLELNGSTILENQAPNTMVGQLIATDPDPNATLSFSFADGNGSDHNALFQIHQNQILRSLQPFDFETNASSYPIRVRVSDQHGANLERIFLISLLNQVEDLDGDGIEDYFDPDDDGDGFFDSAEIAYGSDPRDPNSVANAAPDSLELNGSTILENQAPNTVVGQLIATDPDANATLSFSLVDGNGSNDNSLFSIDANGSLVTLFPFDFETNASTYPIRVRVSDQHGAKLERIFLVSLLNQVEDLDRDGIEDFFDLDDDGDGFSDLFESESGTDPFNPTSIPNQAPSSLSFSTRSFPENLPVGSIIGKFTASDPDANASHTLSLVDGNGSKDNALFAIDANGSLVTLLPFDFETNASNYFIRVQVRDEWNASLEESFQLILDDLDENPPVLTLLGPAEITLTTGTSFRDPGAVWTDDREGNGTTYANRSDFNVSKAGTYTLIYGFSDRAGNPAKDLNRTLIVRDPALPLVRTLTAQLDGNDSLSLQAELLDSGGLEIAEIGVEIGTRPSLSDAKLHPLRPEAKTGFYSTIVSNPLTGVELFYRAYAINRMGIAHGSVHKIQLPEVVDPNIWWTQAAVHDGGWRTLDWFGTFLLSDEDYWVYHAQLGWVYLVSDDLGGIWMWKQGLDWLWTSQPSAPFYWLNSTSNWLYPLHLERDRNIFWDYAREQAIRLP